MKRILYAPEVYAYIYTTSGNWIDLTPDIISGTITRKVNDLSTARLVLHNRPFSSNDSIGQQVSQGNANIIANYGNTYLGANIMPMDRIGIWLKKTKPIQVFSGYIDSVPFWQPYPRPITIEASCTLKRLQFTYWDPGLIATQVQLMRLGFYPYGNQQEVNALASGGLAGAAPKGVSFNRANTSGLSDTGFAGLLYFLLQDVGNWNPNSINIEDIPPSWVNRILSVYKRVASDLNQNQQVMQDFFSSMFNTSSGNTTATTPGGTGTSGAGPAASWSSSPISQLQHLIATLDLLLPPNIPSSSNPLSIFGSGSVGARGTLTNIIDYLASSLLYETGKKVPVESYNAPTKKTTIVNSPSHINVDPRLLIALADAVNYNISDRNSSTALYNIWGFNGQKFTNWNTAVKYAANLLRKIIQGIGKSSVTISEILNGKGTTRGWISYLQPGNNVSINAAAVANSYAKAIDNSGNTNWTESTPSTNKFAFPQSSNLVKNPTTNPISSAPGATGAVATPSTNVPVQVVPAWDHPYPDQGGHTSSPVGSGTLSQNYGAHIFLSDTLNSLGVPTVPYYSTDKPNAKFNGISIYINRKPHFKAISVNAPTPAFGGPDPKAAAPAGDPVVRNPSTPVRKTFSQTFLTNSFKLFQDIEGQFGNTLAAVTQTAIRAKNYFEFYYNNSVASVYIDVPEYGVVNETTLWNGIAKAIVNFMSWLSQQTPAATTAVTAAAAVGTGKPFVYSLFRSMTGVNYAGIDYGVDFTYNGNTKVDCLCLVGGTIETIGSGWGNTGAAYQTGNVVWIKLDTPVAGYPYMYYAEGTIGPGITIGKKVLPGDLIMYNVGEIGIAPNPGVNTRVVTSGRTPPQPTGRAMNAFLYNTKNTGQYGGGGAAAVTTFVGSSAADVQTRALTAAFNVAFNFPYNALLSAGLTGYRSFENDIKLFDSISEAVASSLRVFASAPNGDFIAWYPDYFNLENNPYFVLSPYEIQDLTIQLSDKEIATHVYAIGNPFGPVQGNTQGSNLMDQLYGLGVASLDMPNLMDSWFTGGDGPKNSASTIDFARYGVETSPQMENFYSKFGIRPMILQQPSIRNPLLEFFQAYHVLMQQWSKQFVSDVSITFQPELFPGMHVMFDTNQDVAKFCAYVEEVTHQFDYQNGFTTDLTVSSFTLAAASGKSVSQHPSLVLINRDQIDPNDLKMYGTSPNVVNVAPKTYKANYPKDSGGGNTGSNGGTGAPPLLGPVAYPSGGGAAAASGWITQAISQTGVTPANSWHSMLMRQASRESNYNPNSINNYDINAIRGDPSEGLLQVTLSTFATYGPKGGNILDPVDNTIASIEYIIAKYGGSGTRAQRMANGLAWMIKNGGNAY